MSCNFYFSFALCHIFLLFHNIESCEKELLFFSLVLICLTNYFSHILLTLGNQKQSMRIVLVWMNHSRHFKKGVLLSSVLFICLTIAFPDFYWICVTKTTACVWFSFDVLSLQIHQTILIFLCSLQIHLSTPSFVHYCLIFRFPYTMSGLQKQTQSLQELNPEKESWNIVARVVRLWFVKDYTKGKSPFFMEIVLQDKEVL